MSLAKYRTENKKPDYILALLIFGLSVFGIIMVYSASVVESYQVFGYNYFYLNKQAVSFVIGIVCMLIASAINYRVYQKYAVWMLIATIFLLIAVFIPGISLEVGGAHRWIKIGSNVFQPAEIIKLTFIIYLSAWLAKKGDDIKNFKTGFLPFIFMIGIIIFLIMKEPDMGTMSVIVATAAVTFFASGASITHITLGAASLIGLFWIFIKSSPYRFARFATFLNPSSESLGASYHITQAIIAIGSGGLLGVGFGLSKQKYMFLPEAHTDSIFAIITEELGFLRAALVLVAYLLIAWRGYKIAKEAPDTFGRLLAVGITTWIVFQALINLGAMTGLIPLTGVPLPFVSYGGSSLIILLIAVGILLNISKQSNR